MKTRNLLLALGCAAALTACTNEDEPAVTPALRTVTLSVEVAEPADTRVEYTEDGTTYKFAWATGDKLRVFYKNSEDTETYADFEIDSESIDGKKANFTNRDGDFPADFTGTVTIGYCSGHNFVGTNWNLVIQNGAKITTDNPLTNCLAQRTALYAENVAVTDGTLPNVKLNHAYAYLLLKEGLQVTDATLTVGSGDAELILHPGQRQVYFNSTGMGTTNSYSQVRGVYVTAGKLTSDYLVPINVGKEGGAAISLTISASNNGNWSTTVTQPAHAYVPGKIYEVAADNTKWKATLFN